MLLIYPSEYPSESILITNFSIKERGAILPKSPETTTARNLIILYITHLTFTPKSDQLPPIRESFKYKRKAAETNRRVEVRLHV